MSNVGHWDQHYKHVTSPQPYAETATYAMAAHWLARCSLVEDWGCGLGWARKFFGPDQYIGLDGSDSRFCDKQVDLVHYMSVPPVAGILMRHVIEHNNDWDMVLANALDSFTDRMCLVLFTPLDIVTHQLAWEHEYGVPTISFALSDLVTLFDKAGVHWEHETLPTDSHYGEETVIRLSKP